MEMYLFDRMLVSLGRIYTTIPVFLLAVYEESTLAGIFHRRILGSELYKCLLLTLSILRLVMRCLAYFLHFDPPTFEAFREAARDYLDIDAASDKLRQQVFERDMARLRRDKLLLVKMNDALCARILIVESRSRKFENSLAEQERTARQLLLYILSCRRENPYAAVLHLLRSQLVPTKIRLKEAKAYICTILGDLREQERLLQQLLIELLMLRRSTRTTKSATASTHSVVNVLHTANTHEYVSQRFLIELLAMRRETRVLVTATNIRSLSDAIALRDQRIEVEQTVAEWDSTTRCILIEMLRFRRRFSQNLSTSSLVHSSAVSTVYHGELVAELETLRLSEAQARAEKDSLAKSLSDVLASLPLQAPRINESVHGAPINELVLALVFTWQMLHATLAIPNRESETAASPNLVGGGGAQKQVKARTKAARPSIEPGSVRARAFNLGPPKNMSKFLVSNSPGVCQSSDVLRNVQSHPSSLRESPCSSSIVFSEPQAPPPPQYPPGITLPPHLVRPSAMQNHIYGNPQASDMNHCCPCLNTNCPFHSTMMSRGGLTPSNTSTSLAFSQFYHDPILDQIQPQRRMTPDTHSNTLSLPILRAYPSMSG